MTDLTRSTTIGSGALLPPPNIARPNTSLDSEFGHVSLADVAQRQMPYWREAVVVPKVFSGAGGPSYRPRLMQPPAFHSNAHPCVQDASIDSHFWKFCKYSCRGGGPAGPIVSLAPDQQPVYTYNPHQGQSMQDLGEMSYCPWNTSTSDCIASLHGITDPTQSDEAHFQSRERSMMAACSAPAPYHVAPMPAATNADFAAHAQEDYRNIEEQAVQYWQMQRQAHNLGAQRVQPPHEGIWRQPANETGRECQIQMHHVANAYGTSRVMQASVSPYPPRDMQDSFRTKVKARSLPLVRSPITSDIYETIEACEALLLLSTSHRKPARDPRDKDLACFQCQSLFKTKSNVARHNKFVHNQVKNYACTFLGCKRRFTETGKLARHRETVHEKLRRKRDVTTTALI